MYNLLNFFIPKKLIAMYGWGLIDSYSANFLNQKVAYLCTAVVYWWGYTPYTMSTPPVLSSAMYDPTPPYTVHVAPQPMDMSSISLNLGAIQ